MRINSEIIADSITARGERLTSFILTVPQIVVKELLRHRMFSFNSSSMRAIPFKRVLQDVVLQGFTPTAYQHHHTGMQGNTYLVGEGKDKADLAWEVAKHSAVDHAELLYDSGVTKQICSRIIEPYGYAKILVTATEWENFFDLRCPKYEISWYHSPESLELAEGVFRSKKDALDKLQPAQINGDTDYELFWYGCNQSQAEIHIQELAENMWDAMNDSTPIKLGGGEWHMPFSDRLSKERVSEFLALTTKLPIEIDDAMINDTILKIVSARIARISYTTHDGAIDFAADIKLHDRLVESKHSSVFEHSAKAMHEGEFYDYKKSESAIIEEFGWCKNFKGFIQYRKLIENMDG